MVWIPKGETWKMLTTQSILIFPQHHVADIRKGDLSIRMTTERQPGGCSPPVCLFSQRKSSCVSLVLLKYNFFLFGYYLDVFVLYCNLFCYYYYYYYYFFFFNKMSKSPSSGPVSPFKQTLLGPGGLWHFMIKHLKMNISSHETACCLHHCNKPYLDSKISQAILCFCPIASLFRC